MLVIQQATRRYAPTLLLAAGLAIGLPHASRADTPAPAPPRVNVFPGPLIVRANTYGNFNTACVAGVIGNEGDSGRCQVEGYDPSVASYSHYDSVDSVGLFVSNSSKPPTLTLPGASFPTPTRIAVSPPLTPQDLARLRPGMHVAAGTAPPFRSEIASWDGGGHFIDLIGGWARAGHAEPGQIPPGGAPVLINKIERVWALNANVLLLPGGAQSGVGFELGMVNANRAPPETTWGYDSINLGCGSQPVEHPECMAGSAFIARGNWQVAYRAQSGRVAAFMVDQTGKTGNGIGLLSEAPLQPQASDQPSFDFLQYNPAGRGPRFRVTNTGRVVAGGIVVAPSAAAGGGQGASIQLNGVTKEGVNRQAYVAAQPDGTLQLLAPQARIDAGSDMVARGSLTVQGALIASGAAPTHGNDACQRGQISSDSAFIYVCVADHHWRRSPLADF